MIPNTTRSGKGKTMESVKRSVATKGFLEHSKTVQYDTFMIDMHHYAFAKNHREYNTESKA